jgi:glycosidase
MVRPAPHSLLGPRQLLMRIPPGVDVPADTGTAGLRQLAANLQGALGPVTGVQVLAAAALQTAMLGLVAGYEDLAPGALARARGGAPLELSGLQGLDPSEDGALAALLVISCLASNPALSALKPLWELAEHPQNAAVLATARTWLRDEEPALPGLGDLPAALAEAVEPTDLVAQLARVTERWAALLPQDLSADLGRVLGAAREASAHRGGGPGPVQGPGFGGPPPGPGGGVADEDVEAFTEDKEWMPSLVLIAKQAFVWLHQLSRQHGRPITRLDQIPDSELDRLVAQGFTGLWLIGLWERSAASQEIKRRTGNPEAEASAYALFDYVIAERLGGEDGWRSLRDRAAARGLRLASDMVPNHVGLDGRWVLEHPHWFVQLPTPPYPGYRFTGPDLCRDPRVSIQIEDGYWSRTDAAVVFKRTDRRTGEVRYLYHGNDGTQMPWNDTAQLDYLLPEVREAVIQQILAVARRFPIIRFDAAMTLARRHVQRLWHPAPGSEGSVPSRAEHGVSQAAFEAAMPGEFWREVVERIQEEAPDTLLLAEAFWMMEGYFVRSLGMHRVYNSAFMHMLRDEDNAGFRAMLRDVLATSPEVLERFVNFANNPDEESAATQFGKTDKYFGVATLMATLPGLPMFGHGQIEGYTEKYGMEYARAYRDEVPDEGFVAHHEAVILPLLRRRAAFCRAARFALHDLVAGSGVDENVLAFSNVGDGVRSLVLFNNQWQATEGEVRCAEALGLSPTSTYAFRELGTGQEHRRAGAELLAHGLTVQLGGYGTRVFLDWREVAAAAVSDPDLHGPLEEEVDGLGPQLGLLGEAVTPPDVDRGARDGLELEQGRQVEPLADGPLGDEPQ